MTRKFGERNNIKMKLHIFNCSVDCLFVVTCRDDVSLQTLVASFSQQYLCIAFLFFVMNTFLL
jgi:hypothetical protein